MGLRWHAVAGSGPQTPETPAVAFYLATGTSETPVAGDFTAAAVSGPVRMTWANRSRVALAYPATESAPVLMFNSTRVPVTGSTATIDLGGVAHHWIVTGSVRALTGALVEAVFAPVHA